MTDWRGRLDGMAKPRYSQADRELERRLGDLEARFGEFDIPDDRVARARDLATVWPALVALAGEDHAPRINALEDRLEALVLGFEAHKRIIRAALDTLRELDPSAHARLIEALATPSSLVDLLEE
jgi:hypothetical protein